jgi:GntR family transcriptional regulator
MFVNDGARSLLLKAERQKFLGEEWPRIHATIQRLGLKAEELLDGAGSRVSSDATPDAQSDPAPSRTAASDVSGTTRKKEER